MPGWTCATRNRERCVQHLVWLYSCNLQRLQLHVFNGRVVELGKIKPNQTGPVIEHEGVRLTCNRHSNIYQAITTARLSPTLKPPFSFPEVRTGPKLVPQKTLRPAPPAHATFLSKSNPPPSRSTEHGVPSQTPRFSILPSPARRTALHTFLSLILITPTSLPPSRFYIGNHFPHSTPRYIHFTTAYSDVACFARKHGLVSELARRVMVCYGWIYRVQLLSSAMQYLLARRFIASLRDLVF